MKRGKVSLREVKVRPMWSLLPEARFKHQLWAQIPINLRSQNFVWVGTSPTLHSQTISSIMEVLDQRECFNLSSEGWLEFKHVKIIYQSGNQIFYGYHPNREHFDISATSKLQHVQQIPDEAYRPLLPYKTTLVAGANISPYVKQPRLINYDEGSDLGTDVLRESNVCEILRLHPHPNIASYLGCQTSSGRIDGICFIPCPETLMHKFNSGNLRKTVLAKSCYPSAKRGTISFRDWGGY